VTATLPRDDTGARPRRDHLRVVGVDDRADVLPAVAAPVPAPAAVPELARRRTDWMPLAILAPVAAAGLFGLLASVLAPLVGMTTVVVLYALAVAAPIVLHAARRGGTR